MKEKSFHKNHQISAGISLLLLAVFLVYYLINSYKNEKAQLQKEVHYLLTNAFKTAESEVLDQMIFELKGVSWINKEEHLRLNMDKPETEILTVDSIGKHNGVMSRTLVISSKDHSLQHTKDLKVKVELRSDSINLDSTTRLFKSNESSSFEAVEKIFKDNLRKSNLSIKYRIQKDTGLSEFKNGESYKDVFTQDFYSIDTDHNQVYILKEILPELIFSILLYLVVIFAFVSIIRSAKKEKELYDMKNDFMRNMTHELKTPIATIGVALEAIQSFHAGHDKELRDEYYRIAEAENKKLNGLVDKVLQVSHQMDSNRMDLEKLDICQITEEILGSFRWRAEQKGIHLQLECSEDKREIWINAQNYILILHNLIDNAMKYNKSQDAQVVVQIIRTDDELNVKVKDNGIPIPEDQKSKIFEKFYRIPQGDVHDEKGHGLGLYIVAQLVKSIHGRIQLKTSERGNTFEIAFPFELVQ
ncbi:MAG: HAMP domain-containing histidine kinase [Saprospiraceae bacterium]|nr:HAMP domain-containing histidine kinase [Saprospiraceae bacterium]